MSHKKILHLVFTLMICSITGAQPLWAATEIAPEEVFLPVEGTVVFVGDGDTLTVRLDGHEKGTIIRLYGIDCPELKQLWGREARDFTAKLVQDKRVVLEATERGKYGRLIALVVLPDGRCLNEELVKAGLAWFHHPPVFLTLPDDEEKHQLHTFAKQMLEAKTKKIGLWQGQFPLPPWTHRRRKSHGRTTVFATLRGTCYHSKGCPTLQSGADALSRKVAKARGLRPCQTCKPDVKKGNAP